MNVIEIPELNKRVKYPSAWEECSTEQVLYIFRQAELLLAGEIDLLEFRIRVFYHLTGIRRQKKHEQKDNLLCAEQQLIKYDNIVRAAGTVDFIFQFRDGQMMFEFDCVKNMMPEIKIGKEIYYGPSEALFNITFGEYRMAYDYYIRFVDSHNESDLNILCAILYRPAQLSICLNDMRISFNPNECIVRSRKFCCISSEIRTLIFSWFSACDNYFKTGQLEVDGRLISLAPLFRKSSDDNDGVPDADSGELGLTGILMSIADSGTFGPLIEVEKTNLYTVLLKLYQWHLEHKRIEKIHRKHGKSE